MLLFGTGIKVNWTIKITLKSFVKYFEPNWFYSTKISPQNIILHLFIHY